MPLYKRPGNHWKTPTRFDRRESEQEEEESRPLRKIGRPRSLKDITKAKLGGRLGSDLPNGAGPDRSGLGGRRSQGRERL